MPAKIAVKKLISLLEYNRKKNNHLCRFLLLFTPSIGSLLDGYEKYTSCQVSSSILNSDVSHNFKAKMLVFKTRWPLCLYSTGFLPTSWGGSETRRREKDPLLLLTVNRSIKSGSMQPVLHIRSPLQRTRLLKLSTGLRVNCPSLSGRTEKNKLPHRNPWVISFTLHGCREGRTCFWEMFVLNEQLICFIIHPKVFLLLKALKKK